MALTFMRWNPSTTYLEVSSNNGSTWAPMDAKLASLSVNSDTAGINGTVLSTKKAAHWSVGGGYDYGAYLTGDDMGLFIDTAIITSGAPIIANAAGANQFLVTSDPGFSTWIRVDSVLTVIRAGAANSGGSGYKQLIVAN